MKHDKTHLYQNGNDFIPLACHFDQQTLLAKNGQLAQVICIENIDKLGNQVTLFHDIREQIRTSLTARINCDKLAIYTTLLRQETDLTSDQSSPFSFCNDLDKVWTQANNWHKRHTNSLYITIVHLQASLAIKNFASFVNSFHIHTIDNFHERYLQEAALLLSQVSSQITDDLKLFAAYQLKIIAQQDVKISQLQLFLEKILYLTKSQQALADVDLCVLFAPDSYQVLQDHMIFNYQGGQKFCSVLGIKEQQEMSPDTLDAVLQVPFQLIISHALYFIDKKTAVAGLGYSNNLLAISGDDEMQDGAGRKQMLLQDQSMTAFAQEQINITIIEDSYQQMLAHSAEIAKLLGEIGVLAVREDIDLEYAFWAKIPGNFHLIRRSCPILSKYMAGFCSLYNFPTGERYGAWGDAITIFKSNKNTPYYFNFHDQNSGHTLIAGTNSSGKSTLLHFLLAQASKKQPQLLYLTSSIAPTVFMNSMDAVTLKQSLLPNPLMYLDEKQLLEFLKILCGHYQEPLNASHIKLLKKLIAHAISQAANNFFTGFSTFNFTSYEDSQRIEAKIALFIAENSRYKTVKFNFIEDFAQICTIDLSFFTAKSFAKAHYPVQEKLIPNYLLELQQHSDICSAVMFLLLSAFAGQKSTAPKIVAINKLDELVCAANLATSIGQLLKGIAANNAIVVSAFDLQHRAAFENSSFWTTFLQQQAATIVLGSDGLTKSLQKFINFNDDIFSTLILRLLISL
jgi:type IV secretion system protein VirB4